MTCKEMDLQVDRQISGGTLTLTAAASAHLRDCGRCRALYGPAAGAEVPRPVEEAILKQMRQDWGPVQPVGSSRMFLLAFSSIFLLILAMGAFFLGTEALARLSFFQASLVTLLIAAGALLTAQSLSAQMCPGGKYRLRPYLLVLGIPVALILAAAILFPWDEPWRGLRFGLGCARAGLFAAVPLALGVSWLVSRGAPLAPATVGATAGLFAGLAGGLLLTYHCSFVQATHVIVWHVIGIPGAAALAGWLVGWGVGALRRR